MGGSKSNSVFMPLRTKIKKNDRNWTYLDQTYFLSSHIYRADRGKMSRSEYLGLTYAFRLLRYFLIYQERHICSTSRRVGRLTEVR